MKLPGLAYQWFVKDFTTIASPLHRLTQRQAFQWGEDCSCAFTKLRSALIEAPVLAYPSSSSWCPASYVPEYSSSSMARQGLVTSGSPRRFYWTGCRQDVELHVHLCDTCTAQKGLPQRSHTPLQQLGLPWSGWPWTSWGPFQPQNGATATS